MATGAAKRPRKGRAVGDDFGLRRITFTALQTVERQILAVTIEPEEECPASELR
jgi:hypothetical protein